MDNQHPLQNPQLEEVEQPLPEEPVVEATPVVSPGQLKFPEPEGVSAFYQWWADLRERAARREAEVELLPFWRNLAPPFAVVSGLVACVYMIYKALFNFSQIPPRVPWFYNVLESKWEQADKLVLLIAPIAIAVLNAIILRLCFDLFKTDRRLGSIICFILSAINFLVIISAARLYSLILS